MLPARTFLLLLALGGSLLSGERSAAAADLNAPPAGGADSADAPAPTAATEPDGKDVPQKPASPPLIPREELSPGVVRI